jgi:hypothetical protein
MRVKFNPQPEFDVAEAQDRIKLLEIMLLHPVLSHEGYMTREFYQLLHSYAQPNTYWDHLNKDRITLYQELDKFRIARLWIRDNEHTIMATKYVYDLKPLIPRIGFVASGVFIAAGLAEGYIFGTASNGAGYLTKAKPSQIKRIAFKLSVSPK